MQEAIGKLWSQLSFWKLVLTFFLLLVLRISWKFSRIWLEIRRLRSYGAEPYFKFPIGIFSLLFQYEQKGDTMGWNKALAREKPQVRLIASHFMGKIHLQLIDPDLIKDFLSDQTRYTKSDATDLPSLIFGNGLVFSEGKTWKRHRRAISEIFRFDFLSSQIPTIVDTAKELFKAEFSENNGKKVDILTLYQRITGTLIFRIFFGKDLQNLDIEGIKPTEYITRIITLIEQNTNSLENLLFGLPGVKLKLFERNRQLFRSEQNFKAFCLKVIQERKKSQNSAAKKDLLGLLLEYQKDNASNDEGMSDAEVLDQFMTFFIAGMDTTGHLLTMMTYHFYYLPKELQAAILAEAEEISKAGIHATPDLLNKSELTNALMKESLRISIPVPFIFDREALHDHFIGDIRIRKGTRVNCSFISNHYNPNYFKEPTKFNIYRWVQGHEDFEHNAMKNPFVFVPFSAGPRNCIGQHLAMNEARLIFSTFISNFKYQLPEDYVLKLKVGLIYGPAETIYLDIQNRKKD